MRGVYTQCRYNLREVLMRIFIQKWGNSLALRIPAALAKEARLKEGGEAELQFKRGSLVIMSLARKKWTLQSLLSGVTQKNLHGEMSSGDSVGRESW